MWQAFSSSGDQATQGLALEGEAGLSRDFHIRHSSCWMRQDRQPSGENLQTLDEMLERKLLTPAQHGEIAAWITQARTPEAIREMPAALWRTLELASVLMNVDADLMLPPALEAG
jgi:hypothetical protein